MKQNIITLSLFVLLVCSCNPYKRVATDVNRTDKNKAILRQTCEAVFPTQPTQYIKGKDSIITLHDTTLKVTFETVRDTVIKTIYKTITAINTVYRTDTLKTENPFRISEINDLQTEIKVGMKERELLNQNLDKLKFKQFLGWFLFFAGAALITLLKLK